MQLYGRVMPHAVPTSGLASQPYFSAYAHARAKVHAYKLYIIIYARKITAGSRDYPTNMTNTVSRARSSLI